MSVEVVLSRSLMEAVRDASFAFLLFLLHVKCSCKVSFDVARDARSLFVCARYTYLLYQGSESVFMLIQIVLSLMCLNTSGTSRYRECRSEAKCDTHCELLDR